MFIHAAPLSLLLVDDHVEDRALLRQELQRALPGARLDEAGSAADFERLLARPDLPWDAAVTDYQLQWSTGLDVFARLRARLPGLPVILFTAGGNEDLAVHALKEGVDDYITKSPRHYGRVAHALRACTERRRREREANQALEALRRREAQLQIAMDVAALEAWELDPAAREILLAGRSHGPLAGRTGPLALADFLARVHPDDRAALQAAWAAALAAGTRFDGEFRIERDGQWCWLRACAEPGGAALQGRWAGVIQDVTASKRVELQLRSLDRQKNEFIAILSHELRNPLAPLRNIAQLLRSDMPPRRLDWLRDVIERQVGVMARLLDDLLDVSRVMRGRLALQKERLDLREIVAHSAEDARQALARAGHQLEQQFGAVPVWVEGDRVRLQEVVDNLLDNAIKFTPSGGLLTLRLAMDAEAAVLALDDNGIGLEPDMLETIFEPFVQARSSPTQPNPGLGVGLAIVRRFVEEHGGSVHAFSRGPGQGTRFEVRLPLAAERPAGARSRPAPSPAAASAPLHVLVADDEHDLAESLALLLESEGHEVTVAFDGAGAMDAAARVRPQVMVLDIGMPNGSGDVVARWVRRQSWGDAVRLIAVTGWGREADREAAHAAGFDLHLVKPVDPGALLQAIGTPA